MKVYVVRHGETELNKKHVLQGNSDSPLTQRGILGAEKIKDALQDIPFDQVISSNLGRAVKTAEIIAGEEYPIIQDQNVAEMSFGNWQGKTQDEICINEEIAKNYISYFKEPEKYQPIEGAESFEEIVNRAKVFLEKMKKLESSSPNGNVLLVTHGAFIKALILVIKNLPVKDFWNEPYITNSSITVLEVKDGKVLIETEVEVSHLGEHNIKMSASGYLK